MCEICNKICSKSENIYRKNLGGPETVFLQGGWVLRGTGKIFCAQWGLGVQKAREVKNWLAAMIISKYL